MANIKSINGNPIVVGTSGIENGAVTTAKIADNAVIGDKINDGAVRTSKLADGAVTAVKIANLAMTEGKIGNNAVTEIKLADGSVNDKKMSERSVLMDSLGLRVPDSTVRVGYTIKPDGTIVSNSSFTVYDQIYVENGETLIVKGNVAGGDAAISKVITTGSSYNMIVQGGGVGAVNTYFARVTESGYYAVSAYTLGNNGVSIAISKYDLNSVYNVYDILAVKSNSKIYTHESADYEDVYDGKYAGPSGLSDSSIYVTYGFTMASNGNVWFETTESTYLSIVYYPTKAMTNGRRLRKTDSENTLPYEESPLAIMKGFYVVVTVQYSSPEFSLHIDNYEHVDSFNPIIPLANKHVEQVIRQIDNVSNAGKLKVRYVSGTGPQSSTERVEIFVPTFDGYVMYSFVHTVAPSINTNVWRIYEASAYTKNLTRKFALTTSGEWEMAIHIAGRDDFSGGFAHGDEVMTNVHFMADGVEIDVTNVTEAIECRELRVLQVSNVYDPSDHETIYATHGSEHLFNANGLEIAQSVEFVLDETVTGGYLAMFPAAKTAVSKFYTDSHVVLDNIEYGEHNDTKSVTLLGNDGVVMTFSIEQQRGTSMNDSIFLLTDNNGGAYHKCYFYANKESAAVSAGSVWKSKTRYQLNVGSAE